ncbi:DUF4238 domain-containing protein [Synechocystis sp. PCC 7509]|uniref:DUF4238 domain-containing protein n=1 Tax=Synechocystis sp. PCC 7509 TaxID=927677 RepID=UPI0002AD0330|nr:DUF4238 domain-containing protein [Synechocystis sp. PCC 7509]
MSQLEKQHYVPQQYLRLFSHNRKKIFAFSKPEQKFFSPNVNNVASEKCFYDFPQNATQPENIKFIEELFGDLEGRQDRFLRHLQKKIDGIFRLSLNPNKEARKIHLINALTTDQRKDLACIAAIQFLRTKEFRKFIVEMRKSTESLRTNILEEEIIKEFDKLLSISFDEKLISDIKSLIVDKSSSIESSMYKEGLAVIHAKFILDHYKQVAQIFNSHIWLIGINDTDRPLFTSDHPVARHPYLSLGGIASEGIEIAFPLNIRAILIMRDKQYFQEQVNQDNKLFFLTLEDVEHYNKLQIYNSNRYVFCSDDCFDLVKIVCKQQPEICSEDRNRVQLKNGEPQ